MMPKWYSSQWRPVGLYNDQKSYFRRFAGAGKGLRSVLLGFFGLDGELVSLWLHEEGDLFFVRGVLGSGCERSNLS